jgi:hypothetical protein
MFPSIDDDRLTKCLQAADGGNSPLPRLSTTELLAAVAERRRRTQRMQVASAAAIMLISLAAITQFQPAGPQLASQPAAPELPQASVEELQADLASLQREAAIQERVVSGVRRVATLRRLHAEYEHVEPEDDREVFGQEAARSAAISWRYATMVEQGLGDRADAMREYKKVAERFAGTEWADSAAASIKRLASSEQPSS